MGSWIQKAMARGILTSRYPRDEAVTAEVPLTARPPLAVEGGPIPPDAVLTCPVGAVSTEGVDQGRCIRCARCLPNGFAFRGRVEAASRSRGGLGPGIPTADRTGPPLVAIGRSVHVFLVDVGSCNACNLEVLALSNPFYDSQRLGIFFTNSPRHADVLLVVGVPTEEMVEPLLRAYEALPEPKAVVAVGACAVSGGAFAGTPGLRSGLGDLLPVDMFVPGCPPPPVAVLDGLLRLTGRNRAAGEA